MVYEILVYICNFFENNNIKYNGSFIYNYNGWNITYNDYKGHYITDKLVDRNVEKTYDSVKDINNSVKRIINYIDNSEYTNTYYLNWGVKFKNKKKMEFKGTKGKWEIHEDSFNNSNIICNDFYLGEVIDKYDALLISKAPEILEMLNHLHGRIDFSCDAWGSNEGIELSNKIGQLIKEATEL